eukprot:TRINITY_DN979_c0_g1_i1.p1 TRINITY_DN979_c0_g1~~TRINITY_DN979_c0_g1_i1.p1  ORF type:complete len:212 (+),score=54.18 TRINITY_DN979_c0_g1_i1:378-1013(+)
MKTSLAVCVFFALVATVVSLHGVDISQGTSKGDFECLKKKGFDFAIVRCYESVGRTDPACEGSVAAAHEAGMEVDIYMFPCPTCGNPARQVDVLHAHVTDRKIRYGKLWLDIEGTQYWMGRTANREFLKGLIDRAEALKMPLGIYTSASQWDPIFGDYTEGRGLDLWYAHYDNAPNFHDFTHFGGWTKPYMKQYNGNLNDCGTGIDVNYRE